VKGTEWEERFADNNLQRLLEKADESQLPKQVTSENAVIVIRDLQSGATFCAIWPRIVEPRRLQ